MSLRGVILQIKRKKVPFFIKKNDYKGMKIEINCTGSDTIQLHELTEFQGELRIASITRRRRRIFSVNAGTGALK